MTRVLTNFLTAGSRLKIIFYSSIRHCIFGGGGVYKGYQ